ncbi:MAG TPA: alpha/beta hydrolase [Acidimicrobiales bacterium]|nr:alpha/beta hydrolase [Acidimicrobiales bacterium]
MDLESLIDPDIRPLLAEFGDFRLTPDNLAAMRSRPIVQPVPLSDEVERVDHVVPGPKGAPDVVVRVHRPRGATGPLPCVYSIHGGGYVMGSYTGDDVRFDSWCLRHRCIGVSVEYRLAPETPYPGPLEDCYAGLAWVHEHTEELGVDPARTGIMGASAGGGLAAGLALLARDRGVLPVAFQLLIYPMLDDRQTSPSSRVEAPIWNPAANEFGWRSYLGPLYGTDDTPPYAAASRATDLSGLPPGYVMVGTIDGFHDEDVDYALRLNQAGVPTELHVYAGAPHGFDNMMTGAPVAKRARRAMNEWLERRLHATDAAPPSTMRSR